MKEYPHVVGERATLEAILSGRSIARYGDGEFKCALGRKCVSQEADPDLATDLLRVLADGRGCLVGIPNIWGQKGEVTPKQESWLNYATPTYARMLGKQQFYSSFITRPDSAPWIDVPEYWERVRDLWRGRDVVLVLGDRRSLRPEELHEAANLRVVESTTKHAYKDLRRVEEEIGTPSGPVIACLGPAATVLAWRLNQRGIWAIDLGHLGMFMRHAGIYNIAIDSLASKKYRDVLKAMHDDKKANWGGRGDRHAPTVQSLISRVETEKGGPREKITVLDYGAGKCTLREALKPHRVQCYDPGVRGLDVLPKPSDVVVCTDVLEHVEPKSLDAVLQHLHRLTARVALIVVATRPANATLPNGDNAHLIIETPDWWEAKIGSIGWKVERAENRGEKEIRFVVSTR